MLALAVAACIIASVLAHAGPTESDSGDGHKYLKGKWTKMASATPPGLGSVALRSTAIAYSQDDNIIVLFGGKKQSGALSNALWIYAISANTWTDRTCSPSASCPSPRAVHGMAYDTAEKKFIIFGGYKPQGHTFETDETWTYDLKTDTWKKLNFGSQQVPEKRHWGSLEYDPKRGVTYLFGGHYNNACNPGDKMICQSLPGRKYPCQESSPRRVSPTGYTTATKTGSMSLEAKQSWVRQAITPARPMLTIGSTTSTTCGSLTPILTGGASWQVIRLTIPTTHWREEQK
jgi:hypothetical protein